MTPKFVIAPDKFKGALSASDAAAAIERGATAARPDANCLRCPMADGGEGTVDAFLARGRAKREVARVQSPVERPVDAVYAIEGATAILEMAAASGLALVPNDRRDPTRTTTFGTGQLITAALENGARRIIIGLGGSATNDAGVGMLRALGTRFFDENGKELGNAIGDYDRLAKIDLEQFDRRLAEAQIQGAADVDNPLFGRDGAARTFAAQKGATAAQIGRLDEILRRVAAISEKTLGRDYSGEPGAGAAGGLGFALIAYLNARIERGVDLVARECGLDRLLEGAALCLTGEGKIDMQTLHGKTVAGVAERAQKRGVPVIAFGGVVEPDAARALEQRRVKTIAIAPPDMPKETAMKHASQLLEAAAKAAVTSRTVVG